MEFDALAYHCVGLNPARLAPIREVNSDGSFNEAGKGNSIFCLSSIQPVHSLRSPEAEPTTDLDTGGAASADLEAQP